VLLCWFLIQIYFGARTDQTCFFVYPEDKKIKNILFKKIKEKKIKTVKIFVPTVNNYTCGEKIGLKIEKIKGKILLLKN
jgi:hypothetical protein